MIVPFPKGYDPKEDEWFGGQDLKEPGVRKNGTYHLEKRPPWHSDYDSQLGSSAGDDYLSRLKAQAESPDSKDEERALRELAAMKKRNTDLRRAVEARSVAGSGRRQQGNDTFSSSTTVGPVQHQEPTNPELESLRRKNAELRKACGAKSLDYALISS